MNQQPPRPLSIAVTVIQHEDAILMIQRQNPPYAGYWSIPGGKIEGHEDLRAAACRETLEETGLHARFVRYAGLVSEHLVRDGEISMHFMLHLCVLEVQSREVVESEEGPLRWFSREELHKEDAGIIPSDLLMLDELVEHPTRRYFFCELTEDEEGKLRLTKLELDEQGDAIAT